MTGPADPGAPRQRLDEDDHDLLTFGEAGARLRSELAAAAATLIAAAESGDIADLQRARARLDALQAAAQRNSAQPINDTNFEKFFGYPGTVKRNRADGQNSP